MTGFYSGIREAERERFEDELLHTEVECDEHGKVRPEIEYHAKYHCYDLRCPHCGDVIAEVDAPEPPDTTRY
jgi:hypothetical protein